MMTNNVVEQFFEEIAAREASHNRQLDYWCELCPNLTYSPQQFYGLVTSNLEAQRVPGLEIDHVLVRQGGALSSQRLYLQLRRERTVFEICGAPFGTGFFVSSRLFDRRKEPTFRDYFVFALMLACMGAALSVLGFLVSLKWGWVWGVIAGTGVVAVVWTVLRLASTQTFTGLDQILSDLPVIGAIYDHYFHPDTYYRQDTNNAYRSTVTYAVRRAIEEITGQKGVRPMTSEARRSVLAGVHQE